MLRVSFDLRPMPDEQAFYRHFARTFRLEGFGENLDALWDSLTGEVPLPLQITLRHLHGHPAEAAFQRIVSVMREAGRETDGAIGVSVR